MIKPGHKPDYENFYTKNGLGIGVGKILIEKSEALAKEKATNKLRLDCKVIRSVTHLFYKYLGFEETINKPSDRNTR